MIIADTHTHLYFPSFDKDRKKVIQNNKNNGVALQIQIGCDEISSLAALELAKKNENFYCTLGLHPADVKHCFNENKIHRSSEFQDYKLQAKNYENLFTLYEKWTKKNPHLIVGFGETGFDLFHENSQEIFNLQLEIFEKHIELAKKFDKTLVIHSRNARSQTLDFLKNRAKGVRGVIHCFAEDENFAQIMIQEYGFFIGIGGIASYPNASKIREAIIKTPIEFIVTETDAPFLVPQNLRKQYKRNEPLFIKEVIKLIAELKKMDIEKCAEILFQNAKKLYNIS